MPEKTVREMTALERRHYSLEARMFHAVEMVSAVLGFVALLIGLGLYVYALLGQYVGEAFGLARSASMVIEQVADTETLVGDVMTVYRGLSQEERAGSRTETYRANYAEISSGEDYQMLRTVLREFLDSSDVNDVFLAVYDRETSSLVYIVDPDEREGHICYPGDWEPVSEKELNTFLSWDGTGKLHYFSKRDNFAWLCTAGVPLRNDAGEIIGFVLADVSLAEVGSGIKSFLIQYVIGIAIATVLIGFFLTRHMKKTLVQPINEIAEAAQNYAQDKKKGEPRSDYFAMLNIRTGDEVENLSLVLADMERDLTEYEENLTKITAEKERIGTELALATRIQADMLPNIFPAFPERPDFDIYASMDPAKEVGGDFYDFFLIDEKHLGLVMADVSGKGVPAALFMMISKILVQNYAMTGRSPAQVLQAVNDQICSNNREEMFVTVWLGVLDTETGKITAANAGHEYPVLMQAGGQFELVKDKHGFVIGGMDGMRYKEYELTLTPGSRLFLYTDGVPEATNAQREMFGTDRMLDALNEAPDAAPEMILKNVRKAVDGFVKDAEQFDDLTMLCVEYKGVHS
jgi:sigma-B regulation protein RsbU (phosphoserine phosphatase)